MSAHERKNIRTNSTGSHIFRYEAVRAASGRRNPSYPVGATRKASDSLTFAVGGPVAYAIGSPGLKAMGPWYAVSNPPITGGQ
jgi:hypothetical protein